MPHSDVKKQAKRKTKRRDLCPSSPGHSNRETQRLITFESHFEVKQVRGDRVKHTKPLDDNTEPLVSSAAELEVA